jgi:predicted RNA-binding protein YlxR (DUF448 family)
MKSNQKTIPERTCIACHQVKPKKRLTRLVRTADGILIDNTGKKAGRGAYLCRSVQCWEMGLKGNRIEQTLKVTLTEANREELKRFARSLVSEERMA